MKLKEALPLAFVVGISVAFTGCSVSDSNAPTRKSSETLEPMQSHELVAIATTVEDEDQKISLAVPLQGGSYSVILECSGENNSSVITWQSDKKQNHGEITVPCTREAGVVREQITLDGYSNSLTFVTRNLVGHELKVSVAPVAT